MKPTRNRADEKVAKVRAKVCEALDKLYQMELEER